MVKEDYMKKLRYVFYAFLILFFLLFIYLEILFSDGGEKGIATVWNIKAAYPCEFVNNQWVSKEVFTSSEIIYICTSISTNKTLTEYDLSIKVFTEAEMMRNRSIFPRSSRPIFEENYQFSIQDKYIRINYDFQPGKYVVGAYYGRYILFEIPIEIIE